MLELLEKYVPLVDFLGIVLGEFCEVVLQDCSEEQCIVKIANGKVSGRKEGAPLTDLALRFMADGVWKEKDYQCLYTGTTHDNRKLQSSTYFIKDKEMLVGMLCINCDTTKIKMISDVILQLGRIIEEPTNVQSIEVTEDYEETFSESLSDTVRSNISEILGDSQIPPDRLKQHEKIELVKHLNKRGVFQLKGAVSTVAQELSCSEATMYRYLSKVNKNR